MAEYESSVIPLTMFKQAALAGDKAIRYLLGAGMTRERLASLAGKAIDQVSEELDEEKRVVEAKAEAEAARKKTALGRLAAAEAQWKQRADIRAGRVKPRR